AGVHPGAHLLHHGLGRLGRPASVSRGPLRARPTPCRRARRRPRAGHGAGERRLRTGLRGLKRYGTRIAPASILSALIHQGRFVMAATTPAPVIGIALGGGSARGWAHIGVLAALAERGIEPQIICGTSIGALVGGIYAAGKLAELEAWVTALTPREVLGLVDFTVAGGGMIGGRRLLELYEAQVGAIRIEELPRRYAAVATDLESGAEVWLQDGLL